MTRTQIFIVAVVGLAMTGSVFLYKGAKPAAPDQVQPTLTQPVETQAASDNSRRMATPTGRKQAPTQNPEKFSGKLESINTGCFSDGECFAMIAGKHVTAIWGWTNETVGTVVGVDSFGDLEKHIGENVEVNANKLDDGSYTLYGNTGYFISLAK